MTATNSFLICIRKNANTKYARNKIKIQGLENKFILLNENHKSAILKSFYSFISSDMNKALKLVL